MRSMLVLLSLSVCASVLAQNHPMPTAVPDPPVICTGCPGNNGAGEPNAGKPTPEYDTPSIALHAGRTVDSSNTPTVQNVGMRTVRAGLVRTAPAGQNRIYLGLGATVGAYTLDTFFSSKLKQPMVAVNTINTGLNYGTSRDPFEKLAKPDRFFYPESPANGWSTPLIDSTLVLGDFDADDRGYLYVGTYNFGWGIVSDPGGTDGSRLPPVVQVTAEPTARALFSLRNGASYYVYHSNTTDSATLYDVTTAATPAFAGTRNGGTKAFVAWTKHEASARVALRSADGHVRVYTYAALIANAPPLADVTPSAGKFFADLSFDENGVLWLAESATASTTNELWRLTPTEEGYATTLYNAYLTSFSPRKIHAAAGYIAVAGRSVHPTSATAATDLILLEVVGGVPQLVTTLGFFHNYYHFAPSGFAQAGPFASLLESVRLVAQGGKTYLFYNASGLGDVYEIGDEPRITSIAPLSGIPAGGTSVSIYGSGFAAGTTVTFDGITASTTFVSASELTAVTPTHASGAVDVVANVPAAASMTAPRQFTYELTPPQQFVATATSTTSIDMTWNSVNGATAYEVSRRAPNGMWSVIGTPAGTSFTDGGRAAETTYVYRVRATDAGANFSAPSAVDLATTFSNESVTIAAGMLIRLADMTHVYARVNAVRTSAGLAPVTFNGTVGGPVLASHVSGVRTALRDARTSLGLTTPAFTDASITSNVAIKAVHLNEVLGLAE